MLGKLLPRRIIALGFVPLVFLWAGTLSARRRPDSRQMGYDQGYQDGLQAGGDDARTGHSYRPTEHDQFKHADHGYHGNMGSRNNYKNAYREGYQAGYSASYNGGRYGGVDGGPNYPRQGPNYPPAGGSYPTPYPGTQGPYNPRRGSGNNMAYETGYNDGLRTGRDDAIHGHSFRPTEHDQFRNADHGYSSAYGNKNAYRQAYRSGYQQGYSEGYRR